MINKIIAEYLKSSPRLIIPEVGALIRRKESNEIVFMEVLKRDDGVLKSLIQNALGVSPAEAAAMIGDYTAAMRAELSANKKYIIDSVGVLFRNADGSLDFTCNPFAHSIPAPEQHTSVLHLDDKKADAPKPAATAEQVGAVDAAEPEEDDAAEGMMPHLIEKIRRQREQPESQSDKIRIRTNRKRIKLDPITILAIIAAALAIGSLIWGAIPSRANLNVENPVEAAISSEEAN